MQNREVGWLHATIRKLLLGDNKIKTVPGELYVPLLAALMAAAMMVVVAMMVMVVMVMVW
jgi:hypothetical protein